jgi:hypothetical protein
MMSRSFVAVFSMKHMWQKFKKLTVTQIDRQQTDQPQSSLFGFSNTDSTLVAPTTQMTRTSMGTGQNGLHLQQSKGGWGP